MDRRAAGCGGGVGPAQLASKQFGNYGGSGWRWSLGATFNYSKRDNTWQLVEVQTSSFHAADPENGEDKTMRPPRDFGKIDIADFDPDRFEGGGAR